MKGYWDNLRASEKRLVVGVAALFFVVLNFLFVFPYFSQWRKVQDRGWEARRKLRVYQNEVAQTNSYWNLVRQLEKDAMSVPSEDQALHFANTVNAEAARTGVRLLSAGRTSGTTNQFFIELSQNLSAQSEEQSLVDFLYNLGSGNSLIRVRDLNVRPDPPRQQLVAQITLVASYQKKVAPKPAPGKPGPQSPSPGISPSPKKTK
jgi:hypothetical protein